MDGEPERVLLDQTALSRSAPAGSGWSLSEDGFLELRLPDKAHTFVVTLESTGASCAPVVR